MSDAHALRSQTEREIGREVVRLVPHWYEADCGPEQYAIPVGNHTTHFFNHCRLTPSLQAFLSRITARTRDLNLEYFVQLPSLIDVLLESYAMEWLRMHSQGVDWPRLIKYLESVARRTNENLPVALNLILRPGTGIGDITQPQLQKFLDRLASSTFSYMAVDSELRLIHYGGVAWSQVKNVATYKFHPEFLHPIHSVMEDRDLSAHLTAQGDLIIMNRAGLLASRRKRKWKIYDVRTFKNSLAYCLGNYHAGANLFEVVFDLSFRREGALLIYDPEHCLKGHILNPESVVHPGWLDEDAEIGPLGGQALISRSIEDIAVGKKAGSLRRKRRLIEMACVDGAVVFDNDRLLAVGALIRSHPSVGNQLGARTVAARSAYLWGGRPIKVSSDGDVTIHFQSVDGKDNCDAVMNFL